MARSLTVQRAAFGLLHAVFTTFSTSRWVYLAGAPDLGRSLSPSVLLSTNLFFHLQTATSSSPLAAMISSLLFSSDAISITLALCA